MNILLIYPEFPDTFWSFKHVLKFMRKKALLPPLGLLTVAALLPSAWTKRLVDLNVTRLTENDLAWADYAFISGMTVQRESARHIIARCKEAGVKIVAGGPLFTSEPQLFEQVDHFVLNEAEVTLPPFLADLEQGQARRLYSTTDFADLHQTPAPLWALPDNLDQYGMIGVQYCRGCPHDCEFCNVTTLFGHRPRTKTAQQIIAELDSLYKLGWRGHVFFVDDNLIANKRKLKTELLPALIEWQKDKAGLRFSTQVTITLADDEPLMQMMIEAGFRTIFIGIETPNEAALAECNKNQNRNRNLSQDLKRIQRAGLLVMGGFIVGFDQDTPSIFQQQIDFIQQNGVMVAMVSLLEALPGTRLYDRLKQEGRLLDLSSGDMTDGATNIIPKMNPDTLRQGYRHILYSIYSSEKYYQRAINFLEEYKPPKNYAPIQMQYNLAFCRSIYHLGIMDRERVYYWKLLLRTLFHRPKQFPVAVNLTWWGHHFRKIYKLP